MSYAIDDKWKLSEKDRRDRGVLLDELLSAAQGVVSVLRALGPKNHDLLQSTTEEAFLVNRQKSQELIAKLPARIQALAEAQAALEAPIAEFLTGNGSTSLASLLEGYVPPEAPSSGSGN